MILNFILGGLLFSIIHFVVNTLNNTALGAMISMIPIGFLSTYIIKSRTLLLQYIRNIIFVIIFLAYVPLGPVNYSSELSGIFVFLGELQTLLSGIINLIILNTSSFLILALDSVMPFLILIYETILSLPYSQINFWYVLLILIIISFFSCSIKERDSWISIVLSLF